MVATARVVAAGTAAEAVGVATAAEAVAVATAAAAAEAAAEAEATERAGPSWGSTAFRAIGRPFLIGRALDHAPDGAGGPLSACGSAA